MVIVEVCLNSSIKIVININYKNKNLKIYSKLLKSYRHSILIGIQIFLLSGAKRGN